MVQGNKTTAYTYDKNDELLRTDTLNTDTNKDTVALYKYDKNGNQLAAVNRCQTESDGTTFDLDVSLGANRLNKNVVNHYDAMNQLTETLTKDKKVQYAYDADGLRTAKTVNGTETFYVWDGDQIVLELDGKGKVKKRYVRGTDIVFADEGQGTEKTYYVTNPHGDVVQLLDEEGTVTQDYEYDAFGNEIDKDKKDDNPYRYSGEYYDKETDTFYLRARYYAPAQGRFLTRDTYTGEEDDPLSLHLYTYCENDGVNAWDPSGHWRASIHRKITNRVLSKVENKHKISFGKAEESKKIKKKILKGCTYPDKARAAVRFSTDRNVTLHVLGMAIARVKKGIESEKITDKWHGRDKKALKKLKKDAKDKMDDDKFSMDSYKLLGCVLHAIEDYAAHSYFISFRKFVNNFDSYKAGDPQVVYHHDYVKEIKKDNSIKLLKHKKDKEHRDTKDNPKKYFNEKKVEWQPTTFDKNIRIKSAIKESVEYIKEIKEAK